MRVTLYSVTVRRPYTVVDHRARLLEEGLLLAELVKERLMSEECDVLREVVRRVPALLLLRIARVNPFEDTQPPEVLERHLRAADVAGESAAGGSGRVGVDGAMVLIWRGGMGRQLFVRSPAAS